MIALTVNGKPQELPGETPLLEFLAREGIDRRHIAIGLNGEVVPRQEYERVLLKEGDVVEIVHMVGGG